MAAPPLKPEKLEEGLDLRLGAGLHVEGERETDVLFDGQGRDEVEPLEDIAEQLPPDPGQLPFGKRPGPVEYGPAGRDQPARARIVQTAEQVKEGGFSRPGGTDEGDKLALGQIERDPIHGGYGFAPPLIEAPQVLGDKDGLGGAAHHSTSLRMASKGRTRPARQDG